MAKHLLGVAAALALLATGAARAQEPGVGVGGNAYPNSLPSGQIRTSGAPSVTPGAITDTTGTPGPTKRFTRRPRVSHSRHVAAVTPG